MRTLAPLHFEDLEPHRFEDLVRQLIYDFKSWQSIEAVGRLGADEGIDIRASEQTATREVDPGEEAENAIDPPELPPARQWLFQCKREASIGPTKVRQYVSETLDQQESKPYGFVLAAACDFSKKSRDAFREEVVKRGIGEFYLWGKAELEDMLVRPQNDHLLFGYFGVSLQVRRRSAATRIRSNLSLKRALVRHLGPIAEPNRTEVLIRDPRDTSYPHISNLNAFLKSPRWRYWRFFGHEPVDHIALVAHEYFASYDEQSGRWDALMDHDTQWPGMQELFGLPERWRHTDEEFGEYAARGKRYRDYWSTYIERPKRAMLLILKRIPFARVLAIDELGDPYNPPPHLLVDYVNDSPFDAAEFQVIDRFSEIVPVEPEDRTFSFPNPIPDEPLTEEVGPSA